MTDQTLGRRQRASGYEQACLPNAQVEHITWTRHLLNYLENVKVEPGPSLRQQVSFAKWLLEIHGGGTSRSTSAEINRQVDATDDEIHAVAWPNPADSAVAERLRRHSAASYKHYSDLTAAARVLREVNERCSAAGFGPFVAHLRLTDQRLVPRGVVVWVHAAFPPPYSLASAGDPRWWL